jgi:Methyltransferase domain
MAETLLDIHLGLRGKVSQKWESYFPAYERLFSPIRHNRLSLLEIGVQNGGSLEVWSQYFRQAERIVGCDVDERCGSLWYDDPRVNVVVGNACSSEVKETLLAYSPTFDIVVDDGSHLSRDIIDAFLLYFPTLRPGGIYVVEDTHAIFQQVQGGILSQTSAQTFFKGVADLTNVEHWAQDVHPQTLLTTFFPSRAAFPAWLSSGDVLSIEFLNSLIVVRKSESGSNSLGRRLVCGDEASVNPSPLRHKVL